MIIVRKSKVKARKRRKRQRIDNLFLTFISSYR